MSEEERICFKDIDRIVMGKPNPERNRNIIKNRYVDKFNRESEPSPPPHHSHEKKDITFDDLTLR